MGAVDKEFQIRKTNLAAEEADFRTKFEQFKAKIKDLEGAFGLSESEEIERLYKNLLAQFEKVEELDREIEIDTKRLKISSAILTLDFDKHRKSVKQFLNKKKNGVFILTDARKTDERGLSWLYNNVLSSYTFFNYVLGQHEVATEEFVPFFVDARDCISFTAVVGKMRDYFPALDDNNKEENGRILNSYRETSPFVIIIKHISEWSGNKALIEKIRTDLWLLLSTDSKLKPAMMLWVEEKKDLPVNSFDYTEQEETALAELVPWYLPVEEGVDEEKILKWLEDEENSDGGNSIFQQDPQFNENFRNTFKKHLSEYCITEHFIKGFCNDHELKFQISGDKWVVARKPK